MVRQALAKAGWREIDLAAQPKGHRLKIKIAWQLRTQTPMNRQWITDQLRIGVPAMFPIYLAASIVSSDPNKAPACADKSPLGGADYSPWWSLFPYRMGMVVLHAAKVEPV